MSAWFSPILLLLLIFPVFLPFTQDFYETTKWYALGSIALFTCLWWSIQTLKARVAIFHPGRTFWSLLALFGAGILSVLFGSTNRVEALLEPFGPFLFIFLAFILISSSVNKQKLLTFLLHSVSFISILAVLQLTGLPGRLFTHVPWLQDPLWTPVGSTLGLVSLIGITLPLFMQRAWEAHKEEKQRSFFFSSAAIVILLAAGIGTLTVAWPRIPATLLPPLMGWQIMLETLKRFPAMIVGIGPENFLSAFTAGKPAAFNMTAAWNVRFLANSSMALHLGTTTGAIGLGALLFFLWNLIPRRLRTGLDWTRLLALCALLFAPPSIFLLILCVIVLYASEAQAPTIKNSSHGSALFFGLTALLCASIMGYFLVRAYWAEHTFFRAYVTSQQIPGGQVQREGQRAISLNPYVTQYHEAYAQTNLALAAGLLQQETSGQPLTDADRQAAIQLISQAIREGKIATQLAPKQVTSWETLARLYQSLVGVAGDAENWAVASFRKAVELDPANPGLRMELAGIYLAQKNVDAAITHLAIAATLKPDLAGTHYNLAAAYKEKGSLEAARESLIRARSLLSPGTSDYERVTSEITALEAESGVQEP